MSDESTPGTSSRATIKLAQFGDRAQLVVLVGEGAGRSYTLAGDPVVLGRDESATIQFNSEGVSREHARITRPKGSNFVIEDLGSSNGTRVNGIPLTDKSALQYGDRIQLGATAILVFTRYSELEDQLTQIQKLDSLGVLAGGLAHDFGNVMTIIASNLEYLLLKMEERYPDDRQLLECLGDTDAAAKRGVELVERLTGFARRKPAEATLIDVRELIEGVVKLLRPTLPANIELTMQLDDEINLVGERGPLEQVLLNLCLNARDAMPNGGKIRIGGLLKEVKPQHDLSRLMVSPGYFALLEVRDTGIGMDERTRRQIFEPFYTTKGDAGTGLGLAMSFSTVRNHGGNILVRSSPGNGSTFQIYLPAHRPIKSTETTGSPTVKL